MARNVLDTNHLIFQWRRRRSQRIQEDAESDAIAWGRELCELYDNALIVTPVRIEFLCGTTSQHETRLSLAFLSAFKVADGGSILLADLELAERLAKRVPDDGRRRDFGDCQIAAICERLHYELKTLDTGIPRGNPPR